MNLQFNEQSFIILWVSWCKNKCFWKRFTCKQVQHHFWARHDERLRDCCANCCGNENPEKYLYPTKFLLNIPLNKIISIDTLDYLSIIPCQFLKSSLFSPSNHINNPSKDQLIRRTGSRLSIQFRNGYTYTTKYIAGGVLTYVHSSRADRYLLSNSSGAAGADLVQPTNPIEIFWLFEDEPEILVEKEFDHYDKT